MRSFAFVLLLLFLNGACLTDALEAEIVLVDDIGSFSGAILRIESPVTGEVGDKIFPSEYLTNVGVVKFNIETQLPEVLLNIIITKSGVVVDSIKEGPFVLDGSPIFIDKRIGAESVVSLGESELEEVPEKNISEEVDFILNNGTIPFVENNSKVVSRVADQVAQIDIIKNSAFFLYLIGGLLTFIVLMVMWFKFEVFRGWLTRINYFSEEGELARIEAEIKRKDDLIKLLRKKKERKKKISLARKKLEVENKRLEKEIRRAKER